jgi:hypothetical protein
MSKRLGVNMVQRRDFLDWKVQLSPDNEETCNATFTHVCGFYVLWASHDLDETTLAHIMIELEHECPER